MTKNNKNTSKLALSYILLAFATWTLHQKASKVVSDRMYARFYSCVVFEGKQQQECAQNTKPEGWENLVIF